MVKELDLERELKVKMECGVDNGGWGVGIYSGIVTMAIFRTAAGSMSSAIVGWDIVFDDPVCIIRFVLEDACGVQACKECRHARTVFSHRDRKLRTAWRGRPQMGKGIEHVDLAVRCKKRANQTHERDKKQRMAQGNACGEQRRWGMSNCGPNVCR